MKMDNTGDLSEVCRVCANKIKDKQRQRNIFSYLRGKLLQNLNLITGVTLSKKEGLSKYICERCFSELDLAIKFRERCIFSQNYLEDMLKKTAVKVLSEELIDEDQLEYNTDDIDIVEENYIEEEEQHDIATEFADLIEEDINGEELVETVQVIPTDSEKIPKNDKRHLVLLKDKPPAKRTRNFYICEECGEFFKQENEYKSHLEGHYERRESVHFYPCYQCAESFNTKALLRVHRREEHIGANRLFTCGVCGEVFLEHAAKQRHEKAHVNERPYPCLECDTIFSSVSDLRKHSIIHRQHKFRCEPCNKDFPTRRHLVIHSNTSLHKHTMQQMQDEIEMLDGQVDELEEEEYESS